MFRVLIVCLGLVWAGCDPDDGGVQGEDSRGGEGEVADADSVGSGEVAEEVPEHDTSVPDIDLGDNDTDFRHGVQAYVGHVTDGDTVTVWVGGMLPESYTVRMLGIDAPECHKDFRPTPTGNRLVCVEDDELFGLGAYELLKEMIEGKEVTITCEALPGAWCPPDDFGRRLAYLEIDGLDASVELTRLGGALSFTEFYASKRKEICEAEYEAQEAKRGMWALGTKTEVLDGMHRSTRGWYHQRHDQRCQEAINAR